MSGCGERLFDLGIGLADAGEHDLVGRHPGGECAREFHTRCLACLTEIAERHEGGQVVVVTHGLVLDALYRTAHGLTLDIPRPVPLLNASLNGFGYRERVWRMSFWGDVAHLETVAVTRFEGRNV